MQRQKRMIKDRESREIEGEEQSLSLLVSQIGGRECRLASTARCINSIVISGVCNACLASLRVTLLLNGRAAQVNRQVLGERGPTLSAASCRRCGCLIFASLAAWEDSSLAKSLLLSGSIAHDW
ncbi:uncharacterized protein A4U43_C09F1700 [Asparagus officinalis]|uniref:Uncharacterized protein n=1 Tax=Asparagus officinalis TaxID=4686 RepID=A0A5P1E7U7_ASPOF|nr:uncharacterized protein A4U43_C09F1700 [Asparagus officinalis]